jgi:hypothetical protein
VEIFQLLVWHPARSSRVRDEHHFVFATAGLAYGKLKAEAFGIDENKTLFG